MPGFRPYKSTLLALLVSLMLIAGNAAAVHVHQDGLPHYSDCDSCLQIQAQTGALSGASAPTLNPGYQICTPQPPASAPLPAINAFAARAPPANTLLV